MVKTFDEEAVQPFISVTVTDANGCTSATSKSITETASPVDVYKRQ